IGDEIVGQHGVAGFDPTKVAVDVRGIGMNGFKASDWLYEHARVTPELADHCHLMFLVTIGDDDAGIDRLITAVSDLVDAASTSEPCEPLAGADELLAGAEYALSPRD